LAFVSVYNVVALGAVVRLADLRLLDSTFLASSSAVVMMEAPYVGQPSWVLQYEVAEEEFEPSEAHVEPSWDYCPLPAPAQSQST
jgi:hypothetical protein